MRNPNDPIPVLRRVFTHLDRDEVPKAAGCLLEGMRRVFALELSWYGIGAPPVKRGYRNCLVAMLDEMRRNEASPLDDESYRGWVLTIKAAEAAIEGRLRPTKLIGREAILLTRDYLTQAFCLECGEDDA